MKEIVIGIDVSKEKLDFCLLDTGENILKKLVVENTTSAITSALKKLKREYLFETSDILLCAEYTCQYTYPLSVACEEIRIDLWIENPSEIKQRSDVQRGKNDKLDARKIASYALRYQDKMRLFALPQKNIATLKQLVSERDMFMSDKSKYQGQLTDQKRFMSKENYAQKRKRLNRQIKALELSVSEI